ncbi:hypothetical protein AMECASPLE_039272 [Ameca splendens]|uniref:Uncharacterized protein n=1 Tax=Ameca splendens TaxID=208324 RepID=A0ABV1AET7_9TELE
MGFAEYLRIFPEDLDSVHLILEAELLGRGWLDAPAPLSWMSLRTPSRGRECCRRVYRASAGRHHVYRATAGRRRVFRTSLCPGGARGQAAFTSEPDSGGARGRAPSTSRS